MPLAPRILYSDEVYRLATWHNVTVADVAGDVDALHMRRIARVHRELANAYPSGIAACSILRAGVPASSQESRDEAAKFLKELGDALLRSTLIIEDTGIMAQVLRTVIRGINVVTRNTKLVLCKDLDEAVGSLAPMVVQQQPGANVRAELAAAIAEVRRGYDPRPARQVAQR